MPVKTYGVFRACCSILAASCVLLCACLVLTAAPSPQTQQPSKPGHSRAAAPASAPAPAEGRETFETRCAGCHGLDGRGGERAPDIATRAAVQRRTDPQLFHIIQGGIPNTGMPAFASMDALRISSLVAYLRFLQGRTSPTKLVGNFQAGRTIFFGKALCSNCHIMNGVGGFIASDLTSYASSHSPGEVRDAILHPAKDPSSIRGTAVVVTTREGGELTGMVRNEDNFSLQLQTLDGSFHLLMKSDVKNVSRQPSSLMPANYGSTLTPGEIDDLIGFLMHSAKESGVAAAKKKPPRHDEEEE